MWAASLADASPLARILPLILLTGQRPGEVRQLTWADVEGAWWTIPAAIAKNGRASRVYLTPTALEVARGALVREGQQHVFACRRYHGGERAAVSPGRVFTRVAVAAGLARPWTPHDLRRTAATRLAGLGVSREMVRRVLNHADASVTAVYDHYRYDREVQAALELLEAALLRIVAGAAPAATAPR